MRILEAQAGLGLKNVLYLTDFSAASQNAFAHALALAGRYHSKLFVLHVVPSEPNLGVPLDPMPRAMDTVLAGGERHMDEFLRDYPLRDLQHEVIVSEGDLEAVVADLLEHAAVDLLVMGTHGRTGVGKVVLGSTAEKVLRLAGVPVLTIGPACDDRLVNQGAVGAVLYATDFSSSSLAALPYACTVAGEHHARLILLHVLAGDRAHDDRIAEELKRRMADLLPVGALSSCRPEFVIECGSAAERILAVAKTSAAGLLVLGVRSIPHPALSAHLPWPLVSAVLAHAPCPVLTVRGSE